MKAAKIFDHFLGRQAAIKRGGGGEKADAGTHFLRFAHNVVSGDGGGAGGGRQDGGEHAQGSCLAGAVGAQQSIDAARQATESDAVDSAKHAALLVAKLLAEIVYVNHGDARTFYLSRAPSRARMLI